MMLYIEGTCCLNNRVQMKSTFHKSTFANIPPEKQQNIIDAALQEFFEKGLSEAKIQDIAKRAEVSYGSIYSYFPTKDDLIHTIIQEGLALQHDIFNSDELVGLSAFEKLEKMLFFTLTMARTEARYISIWMVMSLNYNSRFFKHSLEIEKEGIEFWKNFIRQGKEEGQIDPSIDDSAGAYLIDSILANLLKIYVSENEGFRFSLFFRGFPANQEQVIQSLVYVLKKALSPGLKV